MHHIRQENLPLVGSSYEFVGAEQGDANGQRQLGRCLYIGEGVPQDYVEAYKWLELAAAQGLKEAKSDLAELKVWMTSDQLAKAQRLVGDPAPTKAAEKNRE